MKNLADLQERNEVGQGGAIPREPSHYGGAKSLRGAPKRPNKCPNKCLVQYRTFSSERPRFRTCGRQTCFLPRAPSNLVAPCLPVAMLQYCDTGAMKIIMHVLIVLNG